MIDFTSNHITQNIICEMRRSIMNKSKYNNMIKKAMVFNSATCALEEVG